MAKQMPGAISMLLLISHLLLAPITNNTVIVLEPIVVTAPAPIVTTRQGH